MTRFGLLAFALLNFGFSLRSRRHEQQASMCADLGCGIRYDNQRDCQCNTQCPKYRNCCSDFEELCLSDPAPSPSPAPTPPTPPVPFPNGPNPDTDKNLAGVNFESKASIQQRLNVARKLSYGGLWTAYKTAWVDLPGKCPDGGIYEVYSTKCWTPGSEQCGTYKREGDCYNREHSFPKSWWGGGKSTPYTDMHHVLPSDGYVNGKRSAWPFGEVNSPAYTSSEGNKAGSCSTSGASGTCFEPTDRVKGLMARSHLYMATRYQGTNGCFNLRSWTVDLMLKWNTQYPPQPWELELNNRIQSEQGNRNPFIDYPALADSLFG